MVFAFFKKQIHHDPFSSLMLGSLIHLILTSQQGTISIVSNDRIGWRCLLHISLKICCVKSKSLLFSMACAAYYNAKNNPTILKSITKGQSLMNMSNNVVINYLPTNRL